MELMEYHDMYELEDRHWWFQARLRMIEGLLRRHVGRPGRMLDLGCGTGMFLRRRQAESVAYGSDLSPAALAFCRARGIANLMQADAGRIPLADASLDLITAFDLIEHVDDDRGLVDEAWRVLRPGGWFMATVPAHPLLWSSHDVSLHHRRRYTGHEFEGLFEPERWERVRMTSCFALVLPAAVLVRLSRRLRRARRPPHSDTYQVPAWLNHLLVALHVVEARWLERHDLPLGLSLMTIRRKREG